uniref:Immunoglobulin domain-containing protein n=1 Tax=Anabas testudineus TaxID=64144 RepID=A0A7N6BCZ7_ANATE
MLKSLIFHHFNSGLFNFFSTAQLSGNRDEINVLHKRTGTNITVECSFSSTRSWKFFCKEPCEDEKNVLVETNDFSAQRGRYSIRYLRGNPTEGSVFVTITQLTESDSGRYRCGLEGSYRGFELMVTDGVWLLVIVTVVIIVLVLSVVVLILCRKRFHKSSGEAPAEEQTTASHTKYSSAPLVQAHLLKCSDCSTGSQNTGNSRGTNKEVTPQLIVYFLLSAKTVKLTIYRCVTADSISEVVFCFCVLLSHHLPK